MTPVVAAAQAGQPADWLRANQQMQADNPEAALPYLERLVRDYPDVVLYRLELAYVLYLLERDGRARYHFELARGANLTARQRHSVDAALAKIAERKVWSVRFGFSLEPASNAGRGTAAGSVDVGGLDFRVPRNLRAEPATGAVISAGVTYRPRLTKRLEATFSLDAQVKYYDEVALRETLVIGRTGLRFSPAPNTFVEAGLLAGTSYAAGEHYSDRTGIYGEYSRPLGNRAQAQIGFEAYEIRHKTFTLADGPRLQLNAQFAYALAPNALLRARGYVLRTDAEGDLQSGWQGALTLGGTYAFKGGLVTMLDFTVGRDERDGTNALLGSRRRDDSRAVEAQFFNSKYQIGRFLPVLKMKFEENKSNQPLNSYTNKSISIGLRTTF
ncbi:surface lipoprotein assembly modifier [Thalassococcus sp. BH17M4-6]|uniref:surface lipoprotein assembly modifier n=1 Tax=Thalassococcus sp. BH17M4-6 TaxID=3413148 RepID=UPI003BD0307E